jgi:hypothetical protein
MANRKHRLLAVFCSLQAWQRGLDCIRIDRVDLYKYLGVDRLTRERVAEIADDFKPWFPNHEHDIGSYWGEWENSIYFSRVPEAELDAWHSDSSRRRRAGSLAIPKSGLTEEALLACLMSMMLGLAEPQAIFGFDELKRPDAVSQWNEWVSSCIEKWKNNPPDDPYIRKALEAAGLLPKPAPALPEAP